MPSCAMRNRVAAWVEVCGYQPRRPAQTGSSDDSIARAIPDESQKSRLKAARVDYIYLVLRVTHHLLLMMSCLCGKPIALSNIPEYHPDLELAGKATSRPSGNHPPQSPHREPTKEVQRDACDEQFCVGWNSKCPDVSPRFVEPPFQEVLLLDPVLWHAVVDDSGRFVPQLFPCSQQAMAELGVFAFLRIPARLGTQVSSEATILFKHPLLKRHVATEWRLGQRSRCEVRIEKCKRCKCMSILDGDPARR